MVDIYAINQIHGLRTDHGKLQINVIGDYQFKENNAKSFINSICQFCMLGTLKNNSLDIN